MTVFTATGKKLIQLTGTVRNGKIEVAAPSDLADGTRFALLMLNSTLPDTEQMDDSELSRTLAAMEHLRRLFPKIKTAKISAKLHENQPTECD